MSDGGKYVWVEGFGRYVVDYIGFGNDSLFGDGGVVGVYIDSDVFIVRYWVNEFDGR